MSALLALRSMSSTAPTAVVLVDPGSITSVTESPNGVNTVITTTGGARYVTPHTFAQIVTARAQATTSTLGAAVSIATGKLLVTPDDFTSERSAAAQEKP